jgi:hypothetical protein
MSTATLDMSLVTTAPQRLSALARQQLELFGERVDDARTGLVKAVNGLTDRALSALSIPTRKDLRGLSDRLARIETEVERLTGKKLVAQKSVKRAPGAGTKAKKK